MFNLTNLDIFDIYLERDQFIEFSTLMLVPGCFWKKNSDGNISKSLTIISMKGSQIDSSLKILVATLLHVQLHLCTCDRYHSRFFLCKLGMKPRMQLQKIIIFSLKHVIIGPTKIIKDLCKASTYVNAIYALAKKEVFNNFDRSDDDMVQWKNDDFL